MIKDFATSGFFALRTPLLPFEEFLALSQGLTFFKTFHEGGDIAAAAAADARVVRGRLQQFVDRPEVREALWVASPDFFSALSLWRKEPESEKGQRLEHSIYRY